jgi:hypothetical protein
MTAQYVEISKERLGTDTCLLSNGDYIYKGGDRTIFQGQWFFHHKVTNYSRRLPKATNMQEALEEYQEQTGNCII